MSSQEFETGDLVRIAKDLGPTMKHVPADCDAIVVGSYADQFGGGHFGAGRDHEMFTLFLKGSGNSSWYAACHLALIERGRIDLLRQWRDEYEAARRHP